MWLGSSVSVTVKNPWIRTWYFQLSTWNQQIRSARIWISRPVKYFIQMLSVKPTLSGSGSQFSYQNREWKIERQRNQKSKNGNRFSKESTSHNNIGKQYCHSIHASSSVTLDWPSWQRASVHSPFVYLGFFTSTNIHTSALTSTNTHS